MARPKLTFSQEQIDEIATLAEGLTIEQIGQRLGINARTIKRRLADDPRVRQAYDKGRAGAIYDVSQTVLSAARAGNLAAAFFYLKTQAGWRETDPKFVPIDEMPKLTDRELEREKKRMGIVR